MFTTSFELTDINNILSVIFNILSPILLLPTHFKVLFIFCFSLSPEYLTFSKTFSLSLSSANFVLTHFKKSEQFCQIHATPFESHRKQERAPLRRIVTGQNRIRDTAPSGVTAPTPWILFICYLVTDLFTSGPYYSLNIYCSVCWVDFVWCCTLLLHFSLFCLCFPIHVNVLFPLFPLSRVVILLIFLSVFL